MSGSHRGDCFAGGRHNGCHGTCVVPASHPAADNIPRRDNRMNRAHVVCLAFLLSSPAWSAESIKYLALVDGGKLAGQQVVTQGDDGVTRADFIFKDNGRGPELK